MVGDIIKRVVNAFVILLAALAFFLLPLGRLTPAQHCVAIFTTRPAKEAAVAFARAAREVTARVVAEVDEARRRSDHSR